MLEEDKGEIMKKSVWLLLGVALSVGLAACGTAAVPAVDVQTQISEQLAAEVGQAPDSVTCPGDLPAEVGASMTCELTAGKEQLPVMVTVTAVDGTDVNFDIEVGGA